MSEPEAIPTNVSDVSIEAHINGLVDPVAIGELASLADVVRVFKYGPEVPDISDSEVDDAA